MIRAHAPFYGKRFIGDKKKKIVHDTLFEADLIRLKACHIDELISDDIQTFGPDSLAEAKSQDFAPCPVCLWTERRPGKL
jgi:hypothetical protein